MSTRKPCVIGNYKFTGKVLGKGNFARVEEAYHQQLGIKVAAKVMDLSSIKEEYVIRNVHREAKIIAQLRHPCIISLFETMQRSNNIYYIITEIVNGGDLCTYVKAQRSGKLDEKTTKFFAQQFVSALSHMHQKGIVHRDLKMENVMLNLIQNQIKIVDFGLSNEWNEESPLKTHCGSPEYAAPELFVTSKVYGPEVDLWSLGIILYGMVIGQLPFVSSKSPNVTSQERRKLLVAQINKGISKPQRKALASFSFEFRNIMNRLLHADSKKRISVKEMIIHPWVTENGKRFVVSNPWKKISAVTHNKIIREISEVSNKSPDEINKMIKEDPFGRTRGTYNVLLYKYVIKPYNPEQLTRCLSDTVDLHVSWKKEKEILPQRLVKSAREDEERKAPPICRPQSAMNPYLYTSKTKTILIPKIPQLLRSFSISSKNSKIKMDFNNMSGIVRPRSVQSKKASPIKNEKQQTTSALHKRQEYSAALASRFSQNSKRTKLKKNEKNEVPETCLKRRLEYMQKLEPLRGQDVRQNKLSDGTVSKKQQSIPSSSRRLFHEDSSNPKTTSNLNRNRTKMNSLRIPTFNTFMGLVASQGYNKLKENVTKARNVYCAKEPQKSLESRTMESTIEPRRPPARLKIKNKRPSSSHSNREDTVTTPKNTRNYRELWSSELAPKSTSMTRSGTPVIFGYKPRLKS